jgi:Rrf2 family protein
MKFGRECEYAIRATLFLAQREGDPRTALAELAGSQSVAPDDLARILDKLVRAHLILCSPEEEYSLARPAAEVTLQQVIRVYEGGAGLTRCLLDHGQIHPCTQAESCPIHQRWIEVQQALDRVLDSCTFADLAHCAAQSGSPKTPEI